jgi:hypothetical protein
VIPDNAPLKVRAIVGRLHDGGIATHLGIYFVKGVGAKPGHVPNEGELK